MATNLRLREEAEEAVRREAKRTGRSQQEVIRDAVDRHLGLASAGPQATELEALVAVGEIRRPRAPYRRATARLRLDDGVTSADLLDRSDRL